MAHLDNETFYNYYLNLDLKPPRHVRQPGAWVRDIDADAVRESLPTSLAKQPLDFFSGDSRSLAVARSCLELYLADNLDLSHEEMMKHSRHTRPGTQALSWLLQDFDQADLSDNVGFLRCLIHCIIAEGAERQVWQWLTTSENPSVLARQPRHDRDAWRGVVLRFLVEAQAYWLRHEGINASLRSHDYARTISLKPEYIELLPARFWIADQLESGGASAKVDVKLFDQFVRRMGMYKKDFVGTAFARINMLRVHPTKP
jgi:hypothetical protein